MIDLNTLKKGVDYQKFMASRKPKLYVRIILLEKTMKPTIDLDELQRLRQIIDRQNRNL